MRIVLKLAKIVRVSCLPRGNGGSSPNTNGRRIAFGNIGRLKFIIESADELVENDPMSRIPVAEKHDRFWRKASRGA
jgi:hypothetical protein